MLKIEEAKKIEELCKRQLTEGKNICEYLEAEVVAARKELKKFQALYHKNMPNIKDWEELNNILSKQRSPWLRTGLVYEEGSCSNKSECEHTLQTKGNEASTRIRNSNQNYQPRIAHKHSEQKGKPPRFKYQIFFHGYCYCFSNFGHKATKCAFNFTNIQSKNSQLLQHRTRQSASKQ